MLVKKLVGSLFTLLLSVQCYAFYTQNAVIYDKNNKPVNIDGISWSGFQDSKIFQGLASHPFYAVGNIPTSYNKTYGMLDALVHPWDFIDSGVDHSTGVNFKTVRVPIQPGVLYDTGSSVDLNKSISNKDQPTKGNGVFCKTWASTGSTCAATVSPKEALWISLAEFKKNNVKVLIDIHHGYGYGDNYRDGTVYNLNQYEADLKLILAEIKARDLSNVIGIDIFNEPYALHWYRSNNSQPAWIKVIATAAKAIQQNNPDLLLFVEGPGPGSGDPDQPVICVKNDELVPDEAYAISNDPANCIANTKRLEFKGNWGEDFKTLLAKNPAKQGEARFDRAAFIQQLKATGLNETAIAWLMGDENASHAHLIFSPHVYPREVATWESAPGKPSELRFDWSWGFLKKAGYSVVLGEASWKSAEGLAFFQKALIPYLEKNNLQNNLFFWAVGYLGDTVSMIDPNSAKLDVQAQKVLHQLFNQTIDEGKLSITFADPGFNLTGAAEFRLQETGQSYTCSYEGCSFNLAGGTYHLLLAESYQLDNQGHQSYRVKSSTSPIAFQVTEGQNNELTISLEGEQTGPQPASTIDYKINLLDENGTPVNHQTVAATIQFHSTFNHQETIHCVVEHGHCTTSIYNQNINSKTGNFDIENYQIELPNTVQYLGKTYTVVTEKTDKKLVLPANPSAIALHASYQAGTTSSNQGCTVHLALQNRWDGGAVFQGTITNTRKEPIRNFSVKLSFNPNEIANPMIINHWLGNNASLLESDGIFTLSAQPADMSNGLLPGKAQSIGFQLSGTLLQKPVIRVLSCEAE